MLSQAVTNAWTDALSSVAVYPLALAVTRLQVQGKRRQNNHARQKPKGAEPESERAVHSADGDGSDENRDVRTVIRDIYRTEDGLRGLYAGAWEAAGKAAVDSVIRVFAYASFRQRILKLKGLKQSEKLSVINRAAVGLLAEALAVLLTTPIGTVVTRKQTQGLSHTRNRLKSQQIVEEILSEEGFKGLWAGYLASLFSALNVPLTLLVHEYLERILLSRSQKSNTSSSVIYLWVISRATTSLITYPFSVLKTRAQAAPSQPGAGTRAEGSQLSTHLGDFHESTQSEGLGAIYAGLTGEIVRLSANHGVAAILNSLLTFSLHRFRSAFEPHVRLGKEMMKTGTDSHANDTTAPASKIPGWGYMDATAELVGDYVEDDAEDWQSFYHWFWDPERRRSGS